MSIVITNAAGVQLLSPQLHEQIFGSYPDSNSTLPDQEIREKYGKEHLSIQGIWGKRSDIAPTIECQLPGLLGKDIEEHFVRLGLEQSSPYRDMAEQLAKADLPKRPCQWKHQSGWTRYDSQGHSERVAFPKERALIYDVEVIVTEGHYPVMAVAASLDAWYTWISPRIFNDTNQENHLIPFGNTGQSRLLIGHNVGYDRARTADEYNRDESNIRFLDTMSLHIAVSGLCSQQRPAWIMEGKRRNQDRAITFGGGKASASNTGEELQRMDIGQASFFDVSSLNSLKDVAKFHCNIEADKSDRDIFVTGTIDDVRTHLDELISYCARDVDMTHKVYQVVFPKFCDNCPHPVSFAGILHMGSSFLTVSEKWERYLANSVGKHKELEDMLDTKLRDLAEKARERVLEPEVWQQDPWLSQLDWTVNPRQRKLKGQPRWYVQSYDSKQGKLKISTRSRIAPILLRLKWNGFPVHYLSNYGWCYKVQHEQISNTLQQKSVHVDDMYIYFKIPHKDGEQANCGNPLAKNYIASFEDKVMTSEFDAAREALELNAKSAYWISSRERILNQFVVWDNHQDVDLKLPQAHGDSKYGIILPQMVTMGTVTRRAVEKTWLTASNAKSNRIGSELKSMVQAPEGYKIVGADVDSEELWISSLIGDAQFGYHGATALGWMTLQGSKSEGTDLHSNTARIIGINRDKAKIFNYARIYGAGIKYATSLLLQYNHGMDPETAKAKAQALYASTKGEKVHTVKNPFKRKYWHGGSESYMFNALEDISLSKEPRTPVLHCAVTDALRPKYAGTQFLTSRINWVVQSSAVDYLHLLIVSMAHLIQRYGIEARFMLSVHDEVRYLSTERDQYRTAFALQVANIWTRTLFSWKLGIPNLPQSVAFFSSVDIDHVLRKEPTMACTTPSHQEEIARGICLSMEHLLDKLEQDTERSRETDCLLGDELKSTPIPDQSVKTVLDRLQHVQCKPPLCSPPFLLAQMNKERPTMSPFVRGGIETEERIVGMQAFDSPVQIRKSLQMPRRQPINLELGERA